MAEWLSLHALLQRPRVSPVQILGADTAPLVKPAKAASHMPQLEGPTTKNIQLCTGGPWGEEGKIKSLKKKKQTKKVIKIHLPRFIAARGSQVVSSSQ